MRVIARQRSPSLTSQDCMVLSIDLGTALARFIGKIAVERDLC